MKTTADYRLIGGRIKEQRKKKGYTQEQLAEKLDVTVGYISQVERGATKISLDLLASVSGLLDCDPGELVSGSAAPASAYLQNELTVSFDLLDGREKRLALAFIHWLLENRE